MVINAGLTADPGRLRGANFPIVGIDGLVNPAPKIEILANVVVGSLLRQFAIDTLIPGAALDSGVWRAIRLDLKQLLRGREDDNTVLGIQNIPFRRLAFEDFLKERLADLYTKPHDEPAGAAYESRVLQGIWATAPYLHNGSVPSLWELLLPASRRTLSFMVGSRQFDPVNVGYVTDRSPYNYTFIVDAANANGNGNAGHEYGTGLEDGDRRAIIEYLKTL